MLIPILLFITGMAVAFTGFSTIAIGWHRYVLREEIPNSFYVLRSGWPIGGYLLNSLKIFIILILLAFPVMFIAMPLMAKMMFGMSIRNFSAVSLVVSIAFGTFFTWVFLRLGMILPALAVGKKMSIVDSFKLTGAVGGQLFAAAFFVVLFQNFPVFLELIVKMIVGSEVSIFRLALNIVHAVFSWISLFVGIGILTVAYGHLAENKPV